MLGPFIKSIMIPTCFTWEPVPLKAHSTVSRHILKPEGSPSWSGPKSVWTPVPRRKPKRPGTGEGAFCAGAQTPGPGSQKSVSVWGLLTSFQVIRKPHFYVLPCQPSPPLLTFQPTSLPSAMLGRELRPSGKEDTGKSTSSMATFGFLRSKIKFPQKV